MSQGLTAHDSDLATHMTDALPRARLTEEERLEREVMRRRRDELERRGRIFDAKNRTIGLDKPTLDGQCSDKLERTHMEKMQSRAYDMQVLRTGKQLELMEIEKQAGRKDLEKEAKAYSLKNLHFEARREFDINDPLANRKGKPARAGDEDPRCGPASMQQFGGEDLMGGVRKKQQQLDMVNFIEQQKFEKRMLAQMHANEGAAHAQEVKEITELRNQIESNEMSLRRELNTTQKDGNQEQSRANEEQRQNMAHLTSCQNAQELAHHASDPMLNEVGVHHNPNGRVRRDAYKGSTREERVQVRDLQTEQVMQKQHTKMTEHHDNMFFHHQSEGTRKQLVMLEREKQRQKRHIKETVANEHHVQRVEQQKANRDRELLFKNEFRPEFFEQFGVGTR